MTTVFAPARRSRAPPAPPRDSAPILCKLACNRRVRLHRRVAVSGRRPPTPHLVGLYGAEDVLDGAGDDARGCGVAVLRLCMCLRGKGRHGDSLRRAARSRQGLASRGTRARGRAARSRAHPLRAWPRPAWGLPPLCTFCRCRSGRRQTPCSCNRPGPVKGTRPVLAPAACLAAPLALRRRGSSTAPPALLRCCAPAARALASRGCMDHPAPSPGPDPIVFWQRDI